MGCKQTYQASGSRSIFLPFLPRGGRGLREVGPNKCVYLSSRERDREGVFVCVAAWATSSC